MSHTFRLRQMLMLVIALLGACLVQTAFAQHGLRFQRISLEQGLSATIVNTLVQDNRGFIWVGTQDGLNRYDGYGFIGYRHDPDNPSGISDNNIYVLFQEKDGTIWVGTDGGGLNQLDPGMGTFVTHRHHRDRPNSLSSDEVHAIIRDKQQQLWVGTAAGGLNRMNPDGTFVRYLHDPQQEGSLADNRVNVLLNDRQGNLWVGTHSGLNRYQPELDAFEHISLEGAHNVQAVIEDRKGMLWVGTEAGLYRFDRERNIFKRYHRNPDLPGSLGSDLITALLEDGDGKLWVGTGGGGLHLFEEKSNTFQSYTNSESNLDSLSHNHITALLEDRSGVLWIATLNGMNKYNRQMEAFEWYRHIPDKPFSLLGPMIWTVLKDMAGDLWVGTGSGITRYLSNGSYRHYQHDPKDPTSLSHNAVRDVYEDRHGNLWVATRGGGLNLLDRKTDTFRHFRADPKQPGSLSHDQVWVLLDNGEFWVGTAGGGLNRFNRETATFEVFLHAPDDPHSLSDNQVSSLFQEGDTLWVGTYGGGLNRLVPQTRRFRQYRHERDDPRSLSHDRVLCLYRRNKEVAPLWVGTWGGLNRLDPQSLTFRSYREKHGLPSEVVYGILGDEDGFLWMSTNKGLCRFDPTLEQFKVYNVSDGLQSNEFNSGAYFRDDRGKMYFGGIDGLNAFIPGQVGTDPHEPEIVLTDFRLDNESVDPRLPGSPLEKPINQTSELVLDYQQNLISFEFAALHYAAPEKNRYAYKLEGLNKDWIYTSADRRFATFTNLKQGRYRFLVKGSNKDGMWSETPVSLTLVMRPAPWLSPLAKAGYALILLIISGLITFTTRRKLRYKRQVREAIRQSEERLKFALWGSGDEHWDWHLGEGVIYRSNQSGKLCLPEHQDQADLGTLEHFVHPKDYGRLKDSWEDHLHGRTPYFEATYRVRGVRQDWVWILDRGKVVGKDVFGKPQRISGTIKDISKLKETEDKLRLIAIAFENTSDGVFITDAAFNQVAVNQAYTRITGREPHEVLGKPFQITASDDQEKDAGREIMETLRLQGRWHGEINEVRKNEESYQQELLLDQVRDQDGDISHYVGVFSDITFRKKAEAELRRLANYDTLTHLPNRTLFGEHLDQTTNEAVRTNRNFAILFIDLDNFKNINDSLGHSIGDLLLIEVGKRLIECIRSEDVVARFGGDEFSVLLKEVHLVHGAAKVAEKILSSLSEPFSLGGHNIVISPSIGIVLFPSDGRTPEELLRNADTAMYHAKSRGKNNYQFFTDEMNQRVLKRLQMEADLRVAIDEKELTCFYQPKVSFSTGKVVGMEALVRWISPKHGFISPGQFISVAEETGLVVPMGKQVLEIACAQTRHWVAEGLLTGRVAVNLSALQFRQRDLLKFVGYILDHTGLSPDNLELEITEGTLMENADLAVETMRELKKMGITLAIDDFGTGFSSLSYLKRFPVNSLKVDRSFVIDMADVEDDHTIVSSIVGLAHNLGLKVVAEGVENYEQLNALKAMGCEEMQGFLFSKPLPPADFERLLRANTNLYSLN